MKDRPEALQEAAAAGDAEQLPPGAATRMAIGAEMAPAHPASVRTVCIGTEMGRGIDLTRASSRHHHVRWRSAWGLWAGGIGVRTGVAGRLCGEARKGCGLMMALWHWGRGLWCWQARGGAARPHPMEHEAQPHKSDQHQLVEKEIRDHGKPPSYRWRNEGILPGFQAVGISRSLEVHNPLIS